MIRGHRNLPLLLLQAREAAMGHFRPILQEFGLTDQQWRIVRVLNESDAGMEPGRIADVCKILRPSLTGILARMEDMGLIERERSAVDQRRQRISLTAAGRARVRRMLPFIEAQYRLIEEVVGAGALDATYRALDVLLDLLARPVPSALECPAKPRRKTGCGIA
jgi:homoprotocatechuate degradation regulator HpaR